jgi:hypothetical protein
MTELIVEGIKLLLLALEKGLQDDPHVDTEIAENTSRALRSRLQEYKEARKVLEASLPKP